MKRPKPFKFLNSWCLDDLFFSIVADVWRINIQGCHMYVLVSKLKLLKAKLKHWHGVNFSFLHLHISSTEKQLTSISNAMQDLNASPKIFEQENTLLLKLQRLKKGRFSDLQQRIKIEYIRCNDENCRYCFAKITEKRVNNFIHLITDHHGVHHDSQ